ncbi:hypothetical protein D6T64_08880 [Cryobacterium melibiosiphilum]|uniref:Type IV secretion protein Rhs n=1 Tax=Cryobacterium melibiosiphilum TaxID=995039 RepID=A0A3A5MSD4_9MICO|nr:hypothetical protein [Cryobacterium melibiosiphilum]RJT88886.1 hypothetical protein D6T64_08880 [Cryobacterium melibiosiphilum]
MTPGNDSPARNRGPGGFTAWINRRLLPILGPPPVGATGSDLLPAAPAPVRGCPVCQQPIARHDIDRSGERTQLHCPVA